MLARHLPFFSISGFSFFSFFPFFFSFLLFPSSFLSDVCRIWLSIRWANEYRESEGQIEQQRELKGTVRKKNEKWRCQVFNSRKRTVGGCLQDRKSQGLTIVSWWKLAWREIRFSIFCYIHVFTYFPSSQSHAAPYQVCLSPIYILLHLFFFTCFSFTFLCCPLNIFYYHDFLVLLQ